MPLRKCRVQISRLNPPSDVVPSLLDHYSDIGASGEFDSRGNVGFIRRIDCVEWLVSKSASTWLLSHGGIDRCAGNIDGIA
jgi:hypothetical protein